MKKLTKILALFAVAAVLFAGCGKSKNTAEGYFEDVTVAKEAAQKNNQHILVAITMPGDDENSADFVDGVFKAADFKNEIGSKYNVVLMDFSQASYERTVVDAEADKKTQKASDDFANTMLENAKVASMLNAQQTPSLYLLTKDFYVLGQLDYTDSIKTPADLTALIAESQSDIDSVCAMIEATKKGSALEKVAAIDALYEATDPVYQSFLKDMISEVIKLDKNNESGLLSKYLLAKADSEASDAYLTGDAEGASNAYAKICEEAYISPEHKQQAYYLAAYILSMSGSTDFNKVIDYLDKAIEANPDGENVESIRSVKDYLAGTVAAMAASESSLGDLTN